jgi:mRNA interferase RelE/StbE
LTYEIRWSAKSEKALRKLGRTEAERIVEKVELIKDMPYTFVEPLTEIKAWKLRVGDYRVILDINKTTKELQILTLGHRSVIYKRLRG